MDNESKDQLNNESKDHPKPVYEGLMLQLFQNLGHIFLLSRGHAFVSHYHQTSNGRSRIDQTSDGLLGLSIVGKDTQG